MNKVFWQASCWKSGESYDVFEHIARYCARLKLEHRHCYEHHFTIKIILISYGDALAPRLDVSVWHILDRQRRPLWSRSFIARLLELEALQFEREMLLDDENSLTDISKKESMALMLTMDAMGLHISSLV